jgi:acetyl esterase
LNPGPPAGPGIPLVTPASANPVLDPTTQRFLDELAETGRLPQAPFSPKEAREWLTGLQAGPSPKPAADILDLAWPLGPAGSIDIRIVRPPDVAGALPAVLYLHGGSWIMGDRHTHDRLLRELAIGARAAIVFVDYTRAPEAHHPMQIEQAYAALTHLAAHGAAFGLDPARIALAGDGCGAAMVSALILLARRRKGPELAFQLLLYPCTSHVSGRSSFKAFESGPWLPVEVMRAFCQAQFPDPAMFKSDLACPLVTALVDLENQPPALIVTAENDMLRDDGEAYARRLMQAGVNVVATRYNGTIRDFMMLDALAESPPARAATAQAIDALRMALAS